MVRDSSENGPMPHRELLNQPRPAAAARSAAWCCCRLWVISPSRGIQTPQPRSSIQVEASTFWPPATGTITRRSGRFMMPVRPLSERSSTVLCRTRLFSALVDAVKPHSPCSGASMPISRIRASIRLSPLRSTSIVSPSRTRTTFTFS